MNHNEDHPLLEDEGAGYLISVSDLMAGLLFVFIITLMAFVLSYQRATTDTEAEQQHLRSEIEQTEQERDDLLLEQEKASEERDRLRHVVEELTNAREIRSQMLQRIRQELQRLGVQVELDTEYGILHLTEDTIHFSSGKAELPEAEQGKLKFIGDVLALVLPCYAAKPLPSKACDSKYAGKLESVFIEGHTDNVPYTKGRFQDNWDLSAQRAMYTYRYVVESRPILAQLGNTDGFPIFSVSGYGDGRPRHWYGSPTADPANRRIDLRFIMTPPRADLAPVQALHRNGL